MLITKRRIRSLKPYATFVKGGAKIVVGVKNIGRYKEILKRVGFTDQLEPGESLLPPNNFGPVSRFNSEGKYIRHDDMPMETAYRTVEWHWQEFNGPYNRTERTKFVDVPYKRYPRSFVVPPGVEFTIYKKTNEEIILGSPTIEYSEKNESNFIHIINLFLEIFGECQLFNEDLYEFIKTPLVRLNWKILPQGQIPWPQLQQKISPLIKQAPAGNQPFIEYRLETISNYKPDFTAIGEGGFRGYIIFGFKEKKIFICESLYYGNATYIFNEDWESLSKKTKAEIICNNLQNDRIIHRGEGWKEDVHHWVA